MASTSALVLARAGCLLSEHASVVAGNRDHGGPGYAVAAPGKVAVATFTRVLQADEHCFSVGAPAYTGDLTLLRADEKAVDLTCLRVAQQHLVVALTGKVLGIGVVAIGLDPQPAARVERQTIRRLVSHPDAAVFTIRIHRWPLRDVLGQIDHALAVELRTMPTDVAVYKNLEEWRLELADRLDAGVASA